MSDSLEVLSVSGSDHTNETAANIRRFNEAVQTHDTELLVDIVGEDCVMESIELVQAKGA